MISSNAFVLVATLALGAVEAIPGTTFATSTLDDCESSSTTFITSISDDCESSTITSLPTPTLDDCETSSVTTTFVTSISVTSAADNDKSSTAASFSTSTLDDCETSSVKTTFATSISVTSAAEDNKSSTAASFSTSTLDDCDTSSPTITFVSTTFATSATSSTTDDCETSSATSALPTLWSVNTSSGKSCKYDFGKYPNEVCVANGHLNKWERWVDSLPGTFEECVSTCVADYKCASFYYADNLCQTFGKILGDLDFQHAKSEGLWYDRSCFQCYDATEKSVDVDFEDQDASQWAASPEDVVSSAIIQRDASYDGQTWAYKVTEIAETGTGRLDYIPDVSVSAGSYRFRFIGMNNFVRGPTDSLKWELVTVQIANSNGDYFYNGPVTDGIMLKSPWIQFEVKFDVSEDATAHITFLTEMTGYLRDWVFDDIVLERM
ncbi:hypothetical protein B0T10DRAFT_466584 [Thelonectria olida]|uniref:Apple domain-containing protein n=1 Tax=Thelonectria olida TaxID=1576542 RepID=A0A9P9AF21_9HYPO|nr:hypothetical protein B0T10DRAFT_466584 [Thelonectria olida]